MTMHKVLHPRNDIGRLYVLRKEGVRVLASNDDSVDASIQSLHGKAQTKTDYRHQKQY